jgi:hypothetical protein
MPATKCVQLRAVVVEPPTFAFADPVTGSD